MNKCDYCGKETEGKFCNQEHAENGEVFDILENLTEEMDIVFGATIFPWKVQLTTKSYDVVKNRPGTHWVLEVRAYLPRELVYEKDGYEYVRLWENHNIPFIIHARIANKNASSDNIELDDLNRPNIKEEYKEACERDWEVRSNNV